MKGEQHAVSSNDKLPTVALDASAALCEHIMTQGLQSHLFSDITLTFLNKDYLLHKIILSQSSYFHSLLSGPWKEHGKSRIQLQIDDPNVTVEGLELTLAYMYGVCPVFSTGNVVSVLAVACFLCLENLCEKCVEFIKQDLRVERFVCYQYLSEKHCYGRFADSIRNVCWSFLCTHASRELLHVLPKLSLQVLCRLLKSDELWVLSEAERYKLAKQSLIDWKLEHMKHANGNTGGRVPRRTRGKPLSTCKHTKHLNPAGVSRNKNFERVGRINPKEKFCKKRESSVPSVEQSCAQHKETSSETSLERLQQLWEEDTGEHSELYKEDFKKCVDIFTGGGIIFAHMAADEVLQAKKELEDANLPSDVANDSIWHNVLLKALVLKLTGAHCLIDSSSEDEDYEETDDGDGDDEDGLDYADGDESSDRDISDLNSWSTESSPEEGSNNSEDRVRDCVNTSSPKKLKVQNSSLVCFSSIETVNLNDVDTKRRTTGGFIWTAKPDIGMQLMDFPPFRFGAEFVLKDNRWNPCLDSKSREFFYGGSMWKVVASNSNHGKEGWYFGIHCQPLKEYWEAHMYRDQRTTVRFMAKMYIKTTSGLRCGAGSGLRSSSCEAYPSKLSVVMHLGREDIAEDEPLRVSAIVQLVDD